MGEATLLARRDNSCFVVLDRRMTWLVPTRRESCRRYSNWFRRRPVAGPDSLKAPVGGRIDHHAQGAMVIVAERDEAEGLQRSVCSRAHRREHFGHATHRTRLGL